jgi:hypothetical protein
MEPVKYSKDSPFKVGNHLYYYQFPFLTALPAKNANIRALRVQVSIAPVITYPRKPPRQLRRHLLMQMRNDLN